MLWAFLVRLTKLVNMDLATLEKVIQELRPVLIGQRFGRVFQISRSDFIIDVRLNAGRYVFISVSPADPRIYLVRRRLRDVERAALPPSPFANSLRKNLSQAVITELAGFENERVLRMELEGDSEMGESINSALVVQLTGKSANLFVTDSAGIIIDRLRPTQGYGQEVGSVYSPPGRPNMTRPYTGTSFRHASPGSISEELDREDLEKQAAAEFRSASAAARSAYKRHLDKLERRKEQLNNDLALHGDAEKWKRFGDLLLANVATAVQTPEYFLATDYFDDSLPTVSIPYSNEDSVTETAEKYFRKYTKARNAGEQVAERLLTTESEIEKLKTLGLELERAIADEDLETIKAMQFGRNLPTPAAPKSKAAAADKIARRFKSSDGFEILVGKRAKDNDLLTFKMARSSDIWMHAADYPGSHVIIRNPDRKEIPHRTLIEAAKLAAFYSQGKAQVKAAVHYTQKKFVNKPKGSAPGLVSLASFKTLLVEPQVPDALEG